MLIFLPMEINSATNIFIYVHNHCNQRLEITYMDLFEAKVCAAEFSIWRIAGTNIIYFEKYSELKLEGAEPKNRGII